MNNIVGNVVKKLDMVQVRNIEDSKLLIEMVEQGKHDITEIIARHKLRSEDTTLRRRVDI